MVAAGGFLGDVALDNITFLSGDFTSPSTESETGTYAAGAFSLPVTGLTTGETYYYRAFASNSASTSYGGADSFVLGFTLSGTLYENDGITTITDTKSIVAAVGTSSPTTYQTNTTGSGEFSFGGLTETDLAGKPVTVYVDNAAAATLTYGTSSSVSDLDLFAGTVRLQHPSSGGTIDLGNGDFYDGDNDSDIPITISSGTTTIKVDLTVATGTTMSAPANLRLVGDFTQAGTLQNNGGTLTATAQAYNIADAQYNAESLSVSSQDGTPYSLTFNDTGSRYTSWASAPTPSTPTT